MVHSEGPAGWFHGMTNKFGTNFNERKADRRRERKRREGQKARLNFEKRLFVSDGIRVKIQRLPCTLRINVFIKHGTNL